MSIPLPLIYRDCPPPAGPHRVQALLGSYWGHFAHADSVSLRRSLFARMPWLQVFSPCRLMPA